MHVAKHSLASHAARAGDEQQHAVAVGAQTDAGNVGRAAQLADQAREFAGVRPGQARSPAHFAIQGLGGGAHVNRDLPREAGHRAPAGGVGHRLVGDVV